jgi:hypothetical protein
MAPLPGVPGDELASAGMKRELPPPTQAEIQPENTAPRTTKFEEMKTTALKILSERPMANRFTGMTTIFMESNTPAETEIYKTNLYPPWTAQRGGSSDAEQLVCLRK